MEAVAVSSPAVVQRKKYISPAVGRLFSSAYADGLPNGLIDEMDSTNTYTAFSTNFTYNQE